MIDDRPEPRPGLVYVLPHHSANSSEHFAHVPALLAELARYVDVVAVVERGQAPPLPGATRTILLEGRGGRAGRLLRTLLAVRACHRSGHRTYFVRYSRSFLLALGLARPLWPGRVLLWRSGSGDLLEPGASRTVRHRLDEGLNRLLLRLVDRLVTGPESMVDFMSARWSFPRDRVALLYNDVDVNRFSPVPPEERTAARARLGWGDELVVLFVHRLSFRRGTRLLLPLVSAVAQGGRLGRPLRLVVVGDGPDRERLVAEADGAGSEVTVDVLGAVPNRLLPEYYAAADCFVMPSYEEGFPRVLLEAMAAGLPVVTTDAGGSGDVVGRDYPHLVGVGDLPGLQRELSAVLSNDDEARTALGASLRARAVARFTPTQVAPMLRDLL